MTTIPRRSRLFLVRWNANTVVRGWTVRSKIFRKRQYALAFADRIADQCEDVEVFTGGFVTWNPVTAD